MYAFWRSWSDGYKGGWDLVIVKLTSTAVSSARLSINITISQKVGCQIKCYLTRKKRKISRSDLVKSLKQIIGDKLLLSTILRLEHDDTCSTLAEFIQWLVNLVNCRRGAGPTSLSQSPPPKPQTQRDLATTTPHHPRSYPVKAGGGPEEGSLEPHTPVEVVQWFHLQSDVDVLVHLICDKKGAYSIYNR
ncbi:hypothetical protein OPV22_035104 [Ensete ventricosum]|uniref:RST domain-containing protein n=1 Tax=Ensete ventricosum TaxID=4639 RepID=A0AAX5NCX0_ENSVE|nr:hypothetical protein OPV22_035104 [Ensete ventricosum]